MAHLREVQNLASLARLPRRVVRRPSADVRAATIVARQNGAQFVEHPLYADAPQHVAWDIAGDCLRPFLIDQVGEGHFQEVTGSSGGEAAWQPARTLSQKVRCRRCETCLRARRKLWARRAIAEWKAWKRSWFITLTFHPQERYRLLLETRERVGEGFDRLALHDQFVELLRTMKPLVTKWFMRLRKGGFGFAGSRFRYMLVVEKHADGFPHFHALLHEVDDLKPLRKAAVEGQWQRHGFSVARLVKDARAALYVAKYLGKDADARVRASKDYGLEPDDGADPSPRF